MSGRSLSGLGGVSEQTSLFVYGLVTLLVLSIAYLNGGRGANDAWILDGLVLPTLAFVVLYALVVTRIDGNRKIAVLTASFVAVLNVLPGLKYRLFYNTYDTPFHYGFVSAMVSSGHVVATPYSQYYFDNPGMHIVMSTLSLIAHIPVNEVLRFIMPMMYGLVPLIVYFSTQNILPKHLQRYCILAASFPLQGFHNTGTSLNTVLLFILLAVFIRTLFSRNQLRYAAVYLIMSLTTILSHTTTPLFAALLLAASVLGTKVLPRVLRGVAGLTLRNIGLLTLIHATFLMTWWFHVGTTNLNMLIDYIRRIVLGATESAIPVRFFDTPLTGQLAVIAVQYIEYGVVGVLSLIGLVIVLRRLRRHDVHPPLRDFYLLASVLIMTSVVYIGFSVVQGRSYAERGLHRFLFYTIPFCYFFAGVPLQRIKEYTETHRHAIPFRRLGVPIVLSVLIGLSLIQFYHCQPLVPSANMVAVQLPEDEYLFDVHTTNTVYQLRMIAFIETHMPGERTLLGADIVTQRQIRGLADPVVSAFVIYESPLEPNPEPSYVWDLLLLHTRTAGPYGERVEYRTQARIDQLRVVGNIVYDNGASFTLARVD